MLSVPLFQETFSENEDGYAYYCASIVHGAARYMPDFLEYLGDQVSVL